jgi:magnesium-transporting ATPase (P-type)
MESRHRLPPAGRAVCAVADSAHRTDTSGRRRYKRSVHSPSLRATPPTGDDPSLQDGAAVAQQLGCDSSQGLPAAEAGHRLAADGPNQLHAAAAPAAWRRALAPLAEPLSLLLAGAAALSLLLWWLQGAAGVPVDSLVIAAVLVLNTGIGLWQQARADQAVAALARLSAAQASVRRGGQLLRVPATSLVRGDLLVLAEGDAVAADARLLRASSLGLLEAALTGESTVVAKHSATLPAARALADRCNMVWQGTAVVQGHGLAVVTATGMATAMGDIARLLGDTVPPPTPLQVEVARLGRWLGWGALAVAGAVVAAVAALSPPASFADALPMLLLGVSLAVAAVPEGLAAIVTVLLALGVQRMARHQAVVKQLAAVETLGCASVIATDKTGTLTRGEMTVLRLATASGQARCSGTGYGPGGQVLQPATPDQPLADGPLADEVAALLGCAVLACNASVHRSAQGAWLAQGDPTEAALVVADAKLGHHRWPAQRHSRFGELAFSAERQRMATLVRDHQRADTAMLVCKGAPAVVLARCSHRWVGSALQPLDDAERHRLVAEVAALSAQALRTLAVASRDLTAAEAAAPATDALEQGLAWRGVLGLLDPPRPEAAAAITQAQQAGIRVVMITGDHPATALRIATDLGLVAEGATALTGPQIGALDDAALAAASAGTSVYARVAPAQKLRLVRALQQGGAVVAMTGDGVNDAPALRAADIGVAMGLAGTEVSRQAARMVLADDNLATLVHAVREGRGVFDNLRKTLHYLLSSNLGEVIVVLGGVLGAGLLGLGTPGGALVLPLLATQVLWINLITDSGPALALGVEPVDPAVMQRPPRPRQARLIDAPLAWAVLRGGLLMALLTLLTLDACLPGGLIAGSGSIDLARTAAFTTLVLSQLFNALACRSATASALQGGFSNNRWLWGALGLGAVLQVAVVHLPWLNQAFGTVPMAPAQWALCGAMASGTLWGSELRKWWGRRRPRA